MSRFILDTYVKLDQIFYKYIIKKFIHDLLEKLHT